METPLLQHTMFKTHVKYTFLYVFGMFMTGFAVNLIIRSSIGAGGWDAVNDNMRTLLGITLGTASLITNTTVLSIVILFNKSFKYLISVIPIVGIAFMMDLWDIIIFGTWMPPSTGIEIISFIIGIIVLPLGLSFMVLSTYPAMVYDELTFVLMRFLKQKNFMYVRLGIESFAIILATLFGVLAGIGFGSVNLGTVIISLTIGPLINVYLKRFKYIRT